MHSKRESQTSSASMSSVGEVASNGNVEAFPMNLMRSMSSREFVPTPQKPLLIEDEVLSAQRENPLMKQFSLNTDVSSFNPWPKSQTAASSEQTESLYERVIQNKQLQTSFFEDSSAESGDDDCESDEEERSFKFNKDHCLHIFNTLKHGYGNHSNAPNGAYINLSY